MNLFDLTVKIGEIQKKALASKRTGNLSESFKHYSAILKLIPKKHYRDLQNNRISCFYNLGLISACRGDFRSAYRFTQRCLRIQPKHHRALWVLEDIRFIRHIKCRNDTDTVILSSRPTIWQRAISRVATNKSLVLFLYSTELLLPVYCKKRLPIKNVKKIMIYENYGNAIPNPKDLKRVVDEYRMFTNFFFNLFLEKKIKKLVLWNAFTPIYRRSAVYVAQKLGLKIIYFERAQVPKKYIVDNTGFNASSSVFKNEQWKTWTPNFKRIKKYIHNYAKDKITVEKQQGNSNIQHLEKIASRFDQVILVPMQLASDVQLKVFSDWVKTGADFLKIIKSMSDRNKDILFIVKKHPLDTQQYQDVFLNVENVIYVDKEYHVSDILSLSQKVVTINSGVGFESLLYRKTVFVLGDAFYDNAPGCIKITSEKTLIQTIRKNTVLNDENERLRFLDFCVFEYFRNLSQLSPDSLNTCYN